MQHAADLDRPQRPPVRIGHHILARGVQYFGCRGKAALRTQRERQVFADGVEHRAAAVWHACDQRYYTAAAAMQLRIGETLQHEKNQQHTMTK